MKMTIGESVLHVVMMFIMVAFGCLIGHQSGAKSASEFYCQKGDPSLKQYEACLQEYGDD